MSLQDDSRDPKLDKGRRRLTDQKLEETSFPIPDPPEISSRVSNARAPQSSPTGQPRSRLNGDDAGAEGDLDTSMSESDMYNDSFGEDSDEDPFGDKADPGDPVDQIAHMQAQILELKGRLIDTKTQLALEQSRLPTEYDDDYFKAEMDQLRYEIQQWCRTYFANTRGYLTRSAQKRFKNQTHNWAAYLENQYWRPWLIQAHVWDVLHHWLFDGYSKNRASYVFSGLDRKYPVDKRLSQAAQNGSQLSQIAYREWRAATFQLLFPGKGAEIEPAAPIEEMINRHVVGLRKKIWRSLRSYANRRTSREEEVEVQERLEDLVSASVYFDLDMRKYTVDLSLSPKDPILGSDFDPTRMEEVVERKGEGAVELMVSPPLYKHTHASNGAVERRILKKAQICSRYIRKLSQNGVQKVVTRIYTPVPQRTAEPKGDEAC